MESVILMLDMEDGCISHWKHTSDIFQLTCYKGLLNCFFPFSYIKFLLLLCVADNVTGCDPHRFLLKKLCYESY